MDVARASLVRFTNQQIHVADHRRLIREIRGIRLQLVPHSLGARDHIVQRADEGVRRFGCGIVCVDREIEVSTIRLREVQWKAERLFEVGQHLGTRGARNRNGQSPSGYLERQNSVVLEILRAILLSEV